MFPTAEGEKEFEVLLAMTVKNGLLVAQKAKGKMMGKE